MAGWFAEAFIKPTGIPSAQAFGVPVVGAIVPVGIPSAETFGVPTITTRRLISPIGIPSAETIGHFTIS